MAKGSPPPAQKLYWAMRIIESRGSDNFDALPEICAFKWLQNPSIVWVPALTFSVRPSPISTLVRFANMGRIQAP
eukprot:6459699-Amphidinium_carterae.3